MFLQCLQMHNKYFNNDYNKVWLFWGGVSKNGGFAQFGKVNHNRIPTPNFHAMCALTNSVCGCGTEGEGKWRREWLTACLSQPSAYFYLIHLYLQPLSLSHCCSTVSTVTRSNPWEVWVLPVSMATHPPFATVTFLLFIIILKMRIKCACCCI